MNGESSSQGWSWGQGVGSQGAALPTTISKLAMCIDYILRVPSLHIFIIIIFMYVFFVPYEGNCTKPGPALVISRLDCCNVLLAAPPASAIRSLQLIQPLCCSTDLRSHHSSSPITSLPDRCRHQLQYISLLLPVSNQWSGSTSSPSLRSSILITTSAQGSLVSVTTPVRSHLDPSLTNPA